jgi:hypothetical protein
VVRHQPRLVQRRLGLVGLDRSHDAGVQGVAVAAKLAVVGRLLDQRVLEDVVGFRRHAALEQQLGLDQAIEGRDQLAGRLFADLGQQREREFAPERAGDAGDVLDVAQPVEPRH